MPETGPNTPSDTPGATPSLVLASASASRRAMLQAAGLIFDSVAPQLDERALEQGMGYSDPAQIALGLARAKALALSEPDRLVLGSDSLIVCGGQRFDKPATLADAAEHLRFFSGKVMELHSAAALARKGEVVWSHAALARLHVRSLTEDFITAYLAAEWPEVSYCVGVFRMEAMGVQLFDRVEGDHFTILGMPLLPVLGALRDLGEIAA